MGLKTLDKIAAALQSRPHELEQLRKEGKKVVGWLAYNIPEEIIYALGLIPIRVGQGGDGRLVEVGARHISTKNCVFVRHALGQFAEKTDPYIKQLDLVAVDATCIQLYRLEELINFYFGYKTVVLGVPRNFATKEGHEYFRKEVEFFTRKLEAFAGVTLEQSKLQEAIDLYDGIREAIKTLYRYQSLDNAPLRWWDWCCCCRWFSVSRAFLTKTRPSPSAGFARRARWRPACRTRSKVSWPAKAG